MLPSRHLNHERSGMFLAVRERIGMSSAVAELRKTEFVVVFAQRFVVNGLFELDWNGVSVSTGNFLTGFARLNIIDIEAVEQIVNAVVKTTLLQN